MGRRNYTIELVGGPWDGEAGLTWVDAPGDPEPPEKLLIGTCSGSTPWPCTGMREACWGIGRGRPHTAWWAPDEDGIPFDAVRYRRSECEWDAEEQQGRARYVYGRIGLRGRVVSEEAGLPGALVAA